MISLEKTKNVLLFNIDVLLFRLKKHRVYASSELFYQSYRKTVGMYKVVQIWPGLICM